MSWHILEATLAHIRPPIWRQLRVPSDFSLAGLHEVLQIAFGWENSHLHEFRVGKDRYGVADAEEDPEILDEAEATVIQVLPHRTSSLQYIYDLGDYWIHNITVDRIETAPPSRGTNRLRSRTNSAPLACLDGKRACSPEDCGGPHGYAELLEALADANHPRHEELTDWVGGGFDPEAVSLSEINRALRALA